MKHAQLVAPEFAGRRRLLQHIAAGAACGMCGVLQQALAADVSTGQQGIRRMRGTVLVNGEQARVGMIVPPGATVVVGGDSEAAYTIAEDAFLQRAGSQIQINAAATVFRVITGALLSVFRPGTPKTVRMPVATAGIRGTGCYVEVGVARTYFCLCYGAVDLTPDGGRTRSYSTQHHDSPSWIDSVGGVESTGMLSHEDTELAALEGLVGRKVPFPVPYTR